MTAVFAAAPDPAADALFAAIAADGVFALPSGASVLFLNARMHPALRVLVGRHWQYAQPFRPFADALQRAGLAVVEPAADARYDQVLVLPPRQRDEARALLAAAVRHIGAHGRIVVAAANDAGARSLQADLAALCGVPECWSKHRCRVLRSAQSPQVDEALVDRWQALDALQPVAGTAWLSRPGLFAWDRVDRGSELLAEVLPAGLGGRVADLGGGWGYLSCALLQRCAAIRELHLYEASARALPAARHNLAAANAARTTPATLALHWHDVTEGIDGPFDAIVSNPPFHVGRADQPALGIAFIETAAAALAGHGVLWLVANRHLPYEATVQQRFHHFRTVVDADGFKVIEAREPRR